MACLHGRLEIFLLLINCIPIDYNIDILTTWLYSACESGNITLSKLIIDIIIDKVGEDRVNFDHCLEFSYFSGNMDIITFFTQYAPSEFSHALYGACKSGNIELIEFVIDKYPTKCVWNEGLCGACYGGHMNIIEMMITRGANDWDMAMRGACHGGHMEIVEIMIEKGASDWNNCVISGWTGGDRIDIVKFLVNKGATNYGICLVYACLCGDLEFVKILIKAQLILNKDY